MQKTRKINHGDRALHWMLVPGVVAVLLFCYLPLLGSVMAFQQFSPVKGFFGSKWVGLDNFRFILHLPGIFTILRNTLVISFFKILFNILVPVTFALLLNEVANKKTRRLVQTFIYMPNFLSWIILSGILMDILSPSGGAVNEMLGFFGVKPIYFLGNKQWFPATIIATDVWKSFGFGTVIYLASLTAIDPSLYESAMIDGAGRWKQTWHITLPGMMPIIVLMVVLSIGNVLNAGFDQIYNLYSPSVYETGDVIDTFVYRLGLEQRQYAASAAVGLFRSVVSFVLVSFSYLMADRVANYRIF